jgi:hypothetical protein
MAVQISPTRTIHCCDALEWLEQQPVLQGCSFITSLPDISELQGHGSHLTLQQYKSWFVDAAQLVLKRCPDDGVTIFFQTDIKVEGTLLNKAYLAQTAAEQTGHALLWHKIVCRVPPGTVSYSRPSYHHMLCFSKGVRPTAAAATADVLPAAGDTTWARGMGTAACAAACRFVLQHTSTRTVVDPFCGHGTVLAVANELGLSAIGIEIGKKRAKQAERLSAAGLQLNKGSPWPLKQQQQEEEQQQQEEHDGSEGGGGDSSNSRECRQQQQDTAGHLQPPHHPTPPQQQQQQEEEAMQAAALLSSLAV